MRATILLAAFLMASSPALADGASYMTSTPQPAEFKEWSLFLAAHPEQRNERPVIVPLTDELKALTKRINVEVNRAPYRDADGPGDADVWTLLGPGGGDCEDFVLTKRARLIEAGLPAGALLPAYVELADDPVAHMVLVLLTDQGDFIMDNATDRILPWSEAHWPENGKDYRFVYRLYGGTTWQMIVD